MDYGQVTAEGDSRLSDTLQAFVEQQIVPRYDAFDRAHQRSHVQHVIACSLEIARQQGADVNMAYAVAAYHDLGLEGPRETHHLLSGEILASDSRLRRWFDEEQVRIMREAVEDHRASAASPPRSLYGRIVAEADRDVEPESVCRRTVQFGMKHYPELSREGHWERFCSHLHEKYAEGGYLRLLFDASPNVERLARLRSLIARKDDLRSLFDRLFDEERGNEERGKSE